MQSRMPEESTAPARSTLLLPPPEPPWSACRSIRRRRRASLAPREAASSPFSSSSSSWRSPAASGSGAPPRRAGASRTAPSPPRPLPLRLAAPLAADAQPPAPGAVAAAPLTVTRRPPPRGAIPAAAPAPVAIPAAPTAKRVNVVLLGALEESIARALPPEDCRIADQLTQVVNRLLVWDLQVARDGRKGDRLEVLYTPSAPVAPGLPPSAEPVVEAVRYVSQKLGKAFSRLPLPARGRALAAVLPRGRRRSSRSTSSTRPSATTSRSPRSCATAAGTRASTTRRRSARRCSRRSTA